MYHSPHKIKSAHCAPRSEKNDIKTVSDHRPAGKRVLDGFWVAVGKGLQVLIPEKNLAEFYRKYASCSNASERVALCNRLAA